MAGEVGHIVYAARLLTYLQGQVHDPRYWVGTVFPDIRHLGVLSRGRTHPRDVRLGTLIGANDFQTGARVHAWIDATREQFFRSYHIKEHLPWHPFVPFCLNLLEDELLYEYFDDWNLLHRLLNKVHDEELAYIHEPHVIQTWHSILQQYFKQKPSEESRFILARAIGLSEPVAQEANSVVRRLTRDGRAHKLLQAFWHHLEDLLR